MRHVKTRSKGRACEQCGKYNYRRGRVCLPCSGTSWTENDVAYLRDRYALDGAEQIARHLGKTHLQVRGKANALKLTLGDEAARRLVYDVSRERMKAQNPMKRPEVVAKLKATMKLRPQQVSEEYIAAMRHFLLTHRSKVEISVEAMLDEMGISYKPQASIKPKFVVDYLIGRIVLEIDGEYWHCHPRYRNPTQRQLAQRVRDAARDRYLTTCGYTVIRIWESDVDRENIRAVLTPLLQEAS